MGEIEQRASVVAEAMTWLRTPYHHNGAVKGAGVDCAMLPAKVYLFAGLMDHVEPVYPHDWHLHRSEELYLQWAERVGATEIPVEAAGPGDFLIWKFGRTFSHGAIVVDPPLIIHATAVAQMVTLDHWTADEELSSRPRRAFTFWPSDPE